MTRKVHNDGIHEITSLVFDFFVDKKRLKIPKV